MVQAKSIQPGDLLLAVDGGGTKTACCVARAGAGNDFAILSRAQAGPSNPRGVGIETSAAAIQTAVAEAFRAANVDARQCEHALLAIAGTLDPATSAALTARLIALDVASQPMVISDLFPLLDSSTAGASFGLIGGTGSVGIGRNAKGEVAIAGGWGHILGDEGSGFAIGREALQQALQALDSTGFPHGLAAVVCEAWNVSTSFEMKARLGEISDLKTEVAKLARLVVEQAQQSDMAAIGIVLKAAEDQAALIQQLRIRLDVQETQFPVRVTGGLFQEDGFFTDLVEQALGRSELQPTFELLGDPTEAVLRMLAQGFRPEQFQLLQ